MLRHPLNIYDSIDLALKCDHIFNTKPIQLIKKIKLQKVIYLTIKPMVLGVKHLMAYFQKVKEDSYIELTATRTILK